MRRSHHPSRLLSLRLQRAAFTLLEMLIVLAIIGLIAALAVPQLLGRQQDAQIKASQAKIKGFEDAIKYFAVDHDGEYPQGGADTVVGILINPGTDKNGRALKPYVEDVPSDAWGNPLQYEYPPSGNRATPGGKPAIWSLGPDKQDGTDDDITNWNQKL